MIPERILLQQDWAPAGAFLLKVRGHHLNDAHIVNGDYVLVHPQTGGAIDGDIVVTLNGEDDAVQYYRAGLIIVGRVAGVLRVFPKAEAES